MVKRMRSGRYKRKRHSRRRYNKKGRFMRRKRYGRFKRSKSRMISTIAKIMCPPADYKQEWFNTVGIPPLRKVYIDLCMRGYADENAGATVTDNFGDVSQTRDIFNQLYNSTIGQIGAGVQFWRLRETRYFELTNLTNVPMYLKVHKVFLKHDLVQPTLLENMVASVGAYISNNASGQQVTYNNAMTNMGIADIIQAVYAPYIYTSPLDRLQTGNFSFTNFEVLESFFKNPIVRKALKDDFKIVSSKEFVLSPQQQVAFSMKSKKPFLFDELTHQTIVGGTSGTSVPASVLFSAWKGFTCTCIVEVVGMTGTTTGTTGAANNLNLNLGAPSVPGALGIGVKKYVTLANRVTNSRKYVKGASGYAAVAIGDTTATATTKIGGSGNSTGLVTPAANAFLAFGANNVQPQAVAV